jgi:hypothetical protein
VLAACAAQRGLGVAEAGEQGAALQVCADDRGDGTEGHVHRAVGEAPASEGAGISARCPGRKGRAPTAPKVAWRDAEPAPHGNRGEPPEQGKMRCSATKERGSLLPPLVLPGGGGRAVPATDWRRIGRAASGDHPESARSESSPVSRIPMVGPRFIKAGVSASRPSSAIRSHPGLESRASWERGPFRASAPLPCGSGERGQG